MMEPLDDGRAEAVLPGNLFSNLFCGDARAFPPPPDGAAIMAQLEQIERSREGRRIIAFCCPDQLAELQEGLARVPDGDLVTLKPVAHLRPGTVLISPASFAYQARNDEKAPTPGEGRGGLT